MKLMYLFKPNTKQTINCFLFITKRHPEHDWPPFSDDVIFFVIKVKFNTMYSVTLALCKIFCTGGQCIKCVCVCVFVCVCVYVCMCTCMYVCVCTHACTCRNVSPHWKILTTLRLESNKYHLAFCLTNMLHTATLLCIHNVQLLYLKS